MRADEIIQLEAKLSSTIQEAREELRHLHEGVRDARQTLKKHEDEIKETIQAAVLAGFNSIDENAKQYLHVRIDGVVNELADDLRKKLKMLGK